MDTGLFAILVVLVFGLCLAAVLLITAWISDDKELGILRQMWHTFFGQKKKE
ncbi:MAG: hypothetical protein H6673_04110 [Anaerolineales bacterium]|nr:hypothetical protein [Anaerolineales bacterium]